MPGRENDMALAIHRPHLHHPHTRTEDLVLWAGGVAVAALAVFSVIQFTGDDSTPVDPAQAARSHADTGKVGANADIMHRATSGYGGASAAGASEGE